MIAGWTNFLALFKGADPYNQIAFNNKVLQFNAGLLKQEELQLKINDGLRNDIADQRKWIAELSRRIENLEKRL